MKIKTIITAFIFFAFVQDDYREIKHDSFQAGESFDYKVKFGILTIGAANIDVDDKIYMVNSRPCYKVNVLGKTAGITDIFRVKNTYRSYIDTSAIVPQKFLYSARERDYKRDQTFSFDHQSNRVTKVEKDEATNYKVPNNIQDVISGYYFLRTIDFSKLKIGQTVSAPLFFDDELYNMAVKYNGKGRINTKFGKIEVLKLNPILPKNNLFKGEDAIRIWVSNDKNRVPIKLEVDFSVGTAVMELRSYKGEKHPFNWN
ncbi:DUF3108 domain-containing protein [Emticicia sp. CRIBPO]|uniref:DUF3108 domain-containing protein n=1 Tax=Emticicia sp. CRIBPO TaxID=2683258 RepID=UPI001412FF00|nr:DUF3108 domain-containing protein [Emticicia sp. CRIBPO]NBA84479.1 DUF3108 domain-containing protein [Emticicia sp. CRIBPO]